MTLFKVGDSVNIHGIGSGVVVKADKDGGGVEDLYLIELNDKQATATGFFLARNCELQGVQETATCSIHGSFYSGHAECPTCKVMTDLCEDCPPRGYPTDDTRCRQCPNRSARS